MTDLNRVGCGGDLMLFWTPDPVGKRSYKIALVIIIIIIIIIISYAFFLKTTLRIFLKLHMKLDIDKSSKVTEPDFWKKIWFSGKSGKSAKKCGFSYFSRKLV